MKPWVNIGMTDSIDKNEKATDTVFLNNIREELDHSCDSLDGHTQSRLNSIRHAALEHSRKQSGNPFLAPFGGLVTACVLVLLVTVYYPQQSSVNTPDVPGAGSPIEDIDILTSNESLEFFENLEFYQWLEENESSV